MASRQKMIDNIAERLMKGKKAGIKNRKKRIFKRGHTIREV